VQRRRLGRENRRDAAEFFEQFVDDRAGVRVAERCEQAF